MKETIYKRALLKWGERAQLEMAQEESTELALAIRKFIRKPNEKTIDHLAEEMADVEITTEQIKEMYPSILEKIEVHKSFKLDRLSKRLDENKFEEYFLIFNKNQFNENSPIPSYPARSHHECRRCVSPY